ncbi:MAG TPA: nuclear transport factor 2 family protein [Pyrinomonadaceae bacterium]|nr:nuclear transport factor 2 family protein [Pyrinomonadaceae bacterium]
MKRCPTCQRTYADDTLRFCLEDGTPLVSDSALSSDATLLLDSASTEPPPTEILPLDSAPTVRAYDMDATERRRQPAPTAKQQARPTINEFQNVAATTTQKPRSTASVVAITIVATILLLGLGGLGAWLILKDKNSSASGVNSNIVVSNSNPGSNSSNTNRPPVIVSTPNATPFATPAQTATPYSTPSATPTDTSTARREVMNALNGWVETMRAGNLDAHMAYYANTLHTYYLQSNVSSSRVRSYIAPAFSKYTSFDVRLSNVQIDVDPSGEKAEATFDKTFTFSGSSTYSGSGLNRFWFEKFGNRWLITGEKDLKTYYINK